MLESSLLELLRGRTVLAIGTALLLWMSYFCIVRFTIIDAMVSGHFLNQSLAALTGLFTHLSFSAERSRVRECLIDESNTEWCLRGNNKQSIWIKGPRSNYLSAILHTREPRTWTLWTLDPSLFFFHLSQPQARVLRRRNQ